LAFLVLFIAIIGLTGFTIAYGGNNPPVMGHTFGEMDGGTASLGPVGPEGNDGMVVEGDPIGSDDTLFSVFDTTPTDGIGLALEVDGDAYFDSGTLMVGQRMRSYGDIVSDGNIYSGSNFVFDKRASGGTCEEGAVYYDSDLDKLCYCNGASWQQVDGGGSC